MQVLAEVGRRLLMVVVEGSHAEVVVQARGCDCVRDRKNREAATVGRRGAAREAVRWWSRLQAARRYRFKSTEPTSEGKRNERDKERIRGGEEIRSTGTTEKGGTPTVVRRPKVTAQRFREAEARRRFEKFHVKQQYVIFLVWCGLEGFFFLFHVKLKEMRGKTYGFIYLGLHQFGLGLKLSLFESKTVRIVFQSQSNVFS